MKPIILLVSSGLGRINRGYENHISMLGDALLSQQVLPFIVRVVGAKKIKNKAYGSVCTWSRNHWVLTGLKLSWKRRFQIEQASFLLGLLPMLLRRPPACIYLAEYELYCWLFKLRNFFKWRYSLVLYTGGTAVPGLFMPDKDWVHHVTDELWQKAINMGLPENRMFIIPHFVRTDFDYDDVTIANIRRRAGKKKVVLVVGAMNTNHKRMDLAVTILGATAAEIFPVFVGDQTEEAPLVESLLSQYFGKEYILTGSEAAGMGTYYAAADLFFSASNYESFGLAYIEAMWHGLPLVCHKHSRLFSITGSYAHGIDMDERTKAEDAWMLWLKQEDTIYPVSRLAPHQYVAATYTWQQLQHHYLHRLSAVVIDNYN